ncbi:MAG: hypothetical protein ABIK73_07885 [candidate division WOR-3 bacterium]
MRTRIVEIYGRDDETYKDIILLICSDYHLDCRESPEEVIDILKKHGVIREIEPWISITGMEIDREKLREKKQEIIDELEKLDKYIIITTQKLPYYFNVIEVGRKEDVELILDVLENRKIIMY